MSEPLRKRIGGSSRRLWERIVAIALLVWDWLRRLFRRRPPAEATPILQPLTEEVFLPPVENRLPPVPQALFAFPLAESSVAIDPQAWEAILLAQPRSYRVPDPDFVRVLAMQTVVRSLRWGVELPEDGPGTVTIHRDAWNPPYKVPVVEGGGARDRRGLM